MTDIKKALLDPTSVFDNPMEVLHTNDLSREQKIEILQRWRYDAELMETAESENMTKSHGKDMLTTVLEALKSLGA